MAIEIDGIIKCCEACTCVNSHISEPITEAEFNAGFAKYDAWKAEQEASKAEAKAAVLERLGITEEEAKLILS